MLLFGAIMLGPGSDRAFAQYGFGYGMMGGFNYVPSPTDFINSHALIQAGRGQQPRASFQPYANNPNSFHNRLRDNGFVPSYEVRRRQPAASRPQPVRSLGNTARVEPQPAAPPAARAVRAPAEFLRRLAPARLAERIARRGRPEGEARHLRPGQPRRAPGDPIAAGGLDRDRDRSARETAGLRTPGARRRSGRRRRRPSPTDSTTSCSRSTTPSPRPRRRRPAPLPHPEPSCKSMATRPASPTGRESSAHGPTTRATTDSRFLFTRSMWTTFPSRSIRTFVGISVTP